jgi:large subunit ribosomal protein L14e
MLEPGRLCVKIAGREAGQKCIIVDVVDANFVLVDGNVRRKRCNIAHLEPLPETFDLKKGASHEEIINIFEKAGIAKAAKHERKEKAAPAEKKKPSRKRKPAPSEPKPEKKKAPKKKAAEEKK